MHFEPLGFLPNYHGSATPGRRPNLRLLVFESSSGWCPRKAATVDRLIRLFEADPRAAVTEASRVRASWPGFAAA